jgi:polyisoprenyl-teichoic acid--peptidoglycan teichoic acid transferase
MNDFRKIPRRHQRQAIDGILNGPSRPEQPAVSAQAPIRRPMRTGGMRTSGRTIGDFRKAEGYHAANQQAQQSAQRIGETASVNKTSLQNGASLLHMTLPGAVDGKKAKGKSGTGKRDWRKIRKWSLRGSLVALGLMLIVGGFLGIKLYTKLHKVFKGGGKAASLQANVEPSLLKGEGDGRVNILLLGRGGENHAGGDLTDTLLLLSIDPVNKTASMVSVPRDLWVTIPGGSSMKVNAVFANAKNRALAANSKDKAAAEKAGIAKVQEVVGNVLDMPIHYYGLIDFLAFKQAVDTVGGVDINVTEATAVSEHLWDGLARKPYFLDVDPGLQHFDGTRALYYARSRHTSPRGDFDRSERQRLLITALSQKILSAGTYTNPAKISGLLSAFGDHISTDMSVTDAVRLADLGKSVGTKIDSLDLAKPGESLVTTGMYSGQSIVRPAAGISDFSKIQAYVHSKMRDGYIAKENAVVNILNGAGIPGLAATKSDQLKYYGYNVGTVGDAPTGDYAKTVVVDLTKGKKPYTKNYLEKRFGVKVVTKLPDTTIKPGNAQFVIILGKDASTTSQN